MPAVGGAPPPHRRELPRRKKKSNSFCPSRNGPNACDGGPDENFPDEEGTETSLISSAMRPSLSPTRTSPTKRGLKRMRTAPTRRTVIADENFPDEEGTETACLAASGTE